jgi:hypothetical protein
MFTFIHKQYPQYEVQAISRDIAFRKMQHVILEKRQFKLPDNEKQRRAIILKANEKDVVDPNPTVKYLKN